MMTLDLETLAVASFEADATTAELRGMVQARSTDGAGCPDSYPYACLPQPLSAGCA